MSENSNNNMDDMEELSTLSWAALYDKINQIDDLSEMLKTLISILEQKSICGTGPNTCPIHLMIFANDPIKRSLVKEIDDLRNGMTFFPQEKKFSKLSEITIKCAQDHLEKNNFTEDQFEQWVNKYDNTRQRIIDVFGTMMSFSQMHAAKIEEEDRYLERYVTIIDKIHEFENTPPQDSQVSVDSVLVDYRNKAGLMKEKSEKFDNQMSKIDKKKKEKNSGGNGGADKKMSAIPDEFDPEKM